jgi:aldose 1-epimerase
VREALLGCASPEHYITRRPIWAHPWAATPTASPKAVLNSTACSTPLLPSQGENQLHGGPEGFDKRRWQIVRQNDGEVLFSLDSPDGDQGFPGNLSPRRAFA